MDSTTYNVVCTGALLPGYSQPQALEAMAALFKIPQHRAKAYLGSERTIKKALKKSKAHLYKKKLEEVGFETILKPIPKTSFSLELEPMDGQATPPQTQTSTTHQPTATAAPKTIICPKCQREQKEAQQCSGCGVYMHKLLAADDAKPQAAFKNPNQHATLTTNTDDTEDSTANYLSMNSSLTALGAAAVVALIGAWVWKLIAITFNYELGLIAWGIGGAIGFTAAALGIRGQNMGIICGILAFTAIMYGKYLTTTAFQEKLISTLTASLTDEELQDAFNTELETAQYYVNNVTTEAETKAFMVENMYTDAYAVDTVPASDLEHFESSTAPMLRELVNNPPTPKQWLESAFSSYSADETSTWALVKEGFGLLDYLFLFLGIGTAFRLARGDT